MMKVNLLLNNPADVRSGYVNIDPFAPPDSDRVNGDVFNLDHSIDGAEAEEVVAHNILDFAPAAAADQILDNWLSKLAHGGKLTLSVIDLGEVSRHVMLGSIGFDEANTLLHGEQREPWEYRKASYTLDVLSTVLSNKGFKILSKRVQNYRAIVTCQRP